MTSGTIDIKPMTPYTVAIDIEVSQCDMSTDENLYWQCFICINYN